jgi:hypothetical protein
MDCEKFDLHVIAALYDELDELTYAALKRHVEGCSRCASIWAGLRATREVGILPLEEPPDDLEARILDAVDRAQQRIPWHKKALRGLAWAGSHAMRPQLAMAALFFLVIGSSLLLLRARPGTLGPVSVRETGTPAAEPAEVAPAAPVAQALATAAPAEAPPAASAYASAEGLRERGSSRHEAIGDGKAGGADAARASLAEARAARDGSGCAAAVAKLDAVAVAFPGTQPAADAMWDEATCYTQMGQTEKAQALFLALRSTGYRDRAEQQLASAEAKGNTNNQMATAAPAAVAAAPAPAAAPPPARAAKASKIALDAEQPNAAGASAGKAAPKRPAAAGATNPRAPAAPSRAYDSNTGF